MDKTTRLYDRKVLEILDGYIEHQYSETKAGKPRNIEKFKEGADDLFKRAEALLDLESAIKKGKPVELPQWHRDLYAPKPKTEAKKTQTKLVAVAPTNAQIHTIVVREVSKMKNEILEAMQGLKVAK